MVVVVGFGGLVGCADDSRTGGSGGQAGSAGTTSAAGGSGANGGAGTSDKQCRTGTPTDGATLISEHAGSYTFSGRESPCVFDGQTFVSGSRYGVVVQGNPPAVSVLGGDRTQLFAAAWTEGRDLACSGEYTDYFELGSGAENVRVSFVNDQPSGVVLGSCVFVLD